MDRWSKPHRRQHNFFLLFGARHNFCKDFLMEPPNFGRLVSDTNASNTKKSLDFETYKKGLWFYTNFTKQMSVYRFRLATFENSGYSRRRPGKPELWWFYLGKLDESETEKQLVKRGEKAASNDTRVACRLLFCEVWVDQIGNLMAF